MPSLASSPCTFAALPKVGWLRHMLRIQLANLRAGNAWATRPQSPTPPRPVASRQAGTVPTH